MNKLLIMLFAFAISVTTFSQNLQKPVSSMFLELGGNAGLLSVNYDQRFQKGNGGFGWKAGLGIGAIPSGHSFGATPTVPLGINYLLGKGSHYLEAGLGVTLGAKKFSPSGDGISSVFFVPNLGYRLQPPNGGFTIRLFAAPFIGSQTEISGGLSLGSSF
jgi:hypothetical protein